MDCFAELAMTEDTPSRSRGTTCPRFASNFRDLFKKEGAGNAGCALHPRSRVQNCRKLRTRAYRAAEAIRHSLRNGFTAYNVLSPVNGFLATVAPEKLASQELDASAEASGPHVFAVRYPRVRLARASRPPQPVPRCDDGQRPSEWDGMAIGVPLICPSGKAKYF